MLLVSDREVGPGGPVGGGFTVEHMDEVLSASLAVPNPAHFLGSGDHSIDDIYEGSDHPGNDLSAPVGVN